MRSKLPARSLSRFFISRERRSSRGNLSIFAARVAPASPSGLMSGLSTSSGMVPTRSIQNQYGGRHTYCRAISL